jgi:hypothetical protein
MILTYKCLKMKNLFIIVVLLTSYIANAQSVIVAENVNDGRSRDLNTGDLISTNLSARIVVYPEKEIVTLTVDEKDVSYNINETIIYGEQTILNCSNLSQKIQLVYDDINPTFISVSEVDSDFVFFVDIIKHKNLKTRKNGTTKEKFEKNRGSSFNRG